MAPHVASRRTGETASVVAHGLLTSIAVVTAGTVTLWEHWADLSPEKRDYLFQRILAHADMVGDGLRDIAHGLPDAGASSK